jgi:drug/metabolite transporter (DMT)-like permease
LGKIQNKTLVSEIGLFFITMVWGCAFVVVKNTTDSVPPAYMICIRFGMSAILLCVFFFKRLKKIDWNCLKYGLLIGLLNFLGFEFQTIGIAYTTAGKSAFLTSVYCVMVPFLYWIFRHIRPDRYNIASAFLCITGIGILSLREGFSINPGDALSLLCGLVFAVQIIAISILTEKCDPILLCITQSAATTLISLPFALSMEQLPILHTDSILSLLYLGIFSTMIAFVLQLVCQKYTPPAKASLIMSLESVFGTLAGMLFLHESLTAEAFLGFALIFVAILVSETKLSFLRKRKDRKQPESIC